MISFDLVPARRVYRSTTAGGSRPSESQSVRDWHVASGSPPFRGGGMSKSGFLGGGAYR